MIQSNDVKCKIENKATSIGSSSNANTTLCFHRKTQDIISNMSDKEIVSAILKRDAKITRLYLYEKCYPLFKVRYDKYYTDCESCVEFINEIYTYIMTPGVKTGKCYLSTFGFSCSLTCWLKIVAENYCHQLFKKRIYIIYIPEDVGGRKTTESNSPSIDSLNRRDVEIVLSLMPNKRYSSLIHLRYVEEKSNEETADILGKSMDN